MSSLNRYFKDDPNPIFNVYLEHEVKIINEIKGNLRELLEKEYSNYDFWKT